MEVISSFATDRGRKRTGNEDSLMANDWLGLYLVADGMGGHSCGDVASETTVDVIRATVEEAMKNGILKRNPEKVFLDAIGLANRGVWELATKSVKCRNMGTTITGVVVTEKGFLTANVGDSRVYRIRDGRIEQLTTDHSLVAEEVALGVITSEEAKVSPKRNVITRALGLGETVKVDSVLYEVLDGDRLVICSDGLTAMVSDAEIATIVSKESKSSLNRAVADLIETANLNGGTDNITVVVVHFDT